MQGVEILSEQQVVTDIVGNSTAAWTVAIVVFVIFVIYGLIQLAHGECFDGLCCVGFGLIFGLLLWGATYMVTQKPTAYETQYQVIVTDEVSMNEFYENYRVIDHDGRIFTVRERDYE